MVSAINNPRFGHFQKHIYIQLVAIVKIGFFAKTQQILYMIINQLQKMTEPRVIKAQYIRNITLL